MFPNALVMLLLGLMFIVSVEAVCPKCHGWIPGCTSADGSDCPGSKDVTANATALTGAAAIVVSRLLPLKFLRAFPRTVLETLKAVYTSPAGNGQTFDFAGKSVKEVFQALMAGHVTSEEALVNLQGRMLDQDPAADNASIVISQLKETMANIRSIGKTDAHVGRDQSADGPLMYIYAVTDKCIHETESIVLSRLSDAAKEDGTIKFAARLVYPTSLPMFTSRLNAWALVCQATSVASGFVTLPFLEDVVYANLRRGIDWWVVHELFLLYLRRVESGDGSNMGNVHAKGNQDTLMKEAEVNGQANRGKYFRRSLGEPGYRPTDDGVGSQRSAATLKWNIEGNPGSQKFCISFNIKSPHPAGSVDGKGCCKFKHACDKWCVGEDGKRFPCGSTEHSRVDCDNPKRTK
jgi:hypothetical protein